MRRLVLVVGLCVAGGGLAALVTVALDRPSTSEVELAERAGIVDPATLATPPPEPDAEESPDPVSAPGTRVAGTQVTPEPASGRQPRQPAIHDLPGGPFDTAQGAADPGSRERSGRTDKYDPKCQKQKTEAKRQSCQDDLDRKAEEQKAKDKRDAKRERCDEKDDKDRRDRCRDRADDRHDRKQERIDEKYADEEDDD